MIFSNILRRVIESILYTVSPVLFAKYRFLRVMGRLPNLEIPQIFSEKLLWLMLYWRHPLKVQCADKYSMRSYVEGHGLGHLLPELLGVYKNGSDIDFDSLPERFVLKCTHGCGYNIICRSKKNLDIEATKLQLNNWMKMNYSKVSGEIHYSLIKPHIICERYIDDLATDLPIDYKVYCFDGKAHCTMVCTERSSSNGPIFDIYDREWKDTLPYNSKCFFPDKNIPKPGAYEEIIEAAECLSKPFPFVRIDFYSINSKAIIGEMTFTPNGCVDPRYPLETQYELGKLIKLPAKLL